MSKIVQLKDRLGTHEDEYPITLAKAVLMPDGIGNVADAIENARIVDDALSLTSNNPVANKIVTQAIANAGNVKDITVDGVSVLDTTTGIAAITIPAVASLDLTTNSLTIGTTVLDNILTKADLDTDLADAANTAAAAATASAVVNLVGSLTDIDSNGDGTVDAVAPTTVVAAINKVAESAGKIDKISTTDGDIVITNKKITIPDATTIVKGLVNVTETYSTTDATKAMTGKAVADAFTGLALAETGGANKIITTVKEENGVVTATAQDAVVKATTPAATNAAEYTIAGAATKIKLPIATDTTFGEVKYDDATIGVNTDKQLIVKEPFQFLGDATATALDAANITTICENKVPADKIVTKNMIVSIYNVDGIFLGQMLYDGLDWIVFMKSTPYTVTFM